MCLPPDYPILLSSPAPFSGILIPKKERSRMLTAEGRQHTVVISIEQWLGIADLFLNWSEPCVSETREGGREKSLSNYF